MTEPVKVNRGYSFGATPYPLNIKNPDGSTFGWRHAGQDYPTPVGTPVVAPMSGTVIMAGPNGTAGVEVRIQNGNTISRLLHNSGVAVRVGQNVKEGQLVAYSGRTGFVTGPHVHWSVSVDGKYHNPLSFLPKPAPATPVPTPANGKTLILPAVPAWRVYPLNKPPVVGNEVGKIAPAKFGGLTYPIISMPNPNVAIIKTRDFGTVQIWVAPNTGAVIK